MQSVVHLTSVAARSDGSAADGRHGGCGGCFNVCRRQIFVNMDWRTILSFDCLSSSRHFENSSSWSRRRLTADGLRLRGSASGRFVDEVDRT